MNLKTLLIVALFPTLASAQQNNTLSFSLASDSTGIYFIKQIITGTPDSIDSRSIIQRFATPEDARPIVQQWINTVKQDREVIARLTRDNARQASELESILQKLQPQKEQVKPTPDTALEAEILRLRQENEALKNTGQKH